MKRYQSNRSGALSQSLLVYRLWKPIGLMKPARNCCQTTPLLNIVWLTSWACGNFVPTSEALSENCLYFPGDKSVNNCCCRCFKVICYVSSDYQRSLKMIEKSLLEIAFDRNWNEHYTWQATSRSSLKSLNPNALP